MVDENNNSKESEVNEKEDSKLEETESSDSKENIRKDSSRVDAKNLQEILSSSKSSPVLEKIASATETISRIGSNVADISTESLDEDKIKYGGTKYNENPERSYEENQPRQVEGVVVRGPTSSLRGADLRRAVVSSNVPENFEFNPELSSMKKSKDENYTVSSPKGTVKDFKKEYEFR